MVQSATLANERSARLIAIAPTGSPLARACHRTLDLVLDSSSATMARFTNRFVCQIVLEVLGESIQQAVRTQLKFKHLTLSHSERAVGWNLVYPVLNRRPVWLKSNRFTNAKSAA